MDFLLPQISEGTKEAVITAWHVRENGRVEQGEDLVEVTTDKATFDVPSPVTGTLVRILKTEGDAAQVNEAIAEISE